MLTMIVILASPSMPSMLFVRQFVQRLEEWRKNPPPAPAVTAVVVGLLATDVFLPVPSSVVATLSGYQLGSAWGTLAAWAGMSLGAVIGFSLARWLGPRFVEWMTRRH